MDTLISLYRDIWQTDNAKEIRITSFIDDIRNGRWQDLVLPIRAEQDKKKRQDLKKKVPCVTVSGTFSERTDTAIRQHSGLIAIDLDDLDKDVEGTRKVLMNDPYVYTCFTSISGNGLCALFKIDGSKHRDAFFGIEKYLYENYQLIVDKSGKNEARARYVSFDPHLEINHDCLRFKKYLPKEKAYKVHKVVYVQSDFDAIIKGLSESNAPICDNYKDWITIGYAIASKFGSAGADYFDTLSRLSPKYDAAICAKQYDSIVKNYSESKDKIATIATIYYFAKQHGVPTYSEETKRILGAATVLKKSGMTEKSVIDNLDKFEGITPEQSSDIVSQSFKYDIELHGEDSIITSIEQWLKYNHMLRRNCITRRIENSGKPMQQSDFNTMFLAAKKLYPELNYDLFEKIIFSDNTQEYNPLLEFFAMYQDRKPDGVIYNMWSCFNTTNNTHLQYFGTKWLVGLISSCHGIHSPLMLIFCGTVQGTGKTEAFRRMLPDELRPYYAESKLDAGKDDEILMTQKILIMDDEMGGKSKAESKRLKDLTSKQVFSLREPYGRNNVDLHRLAVLCGTTNELNILNDPTGNRRLLPSEIISIDYTKYNAIDKVDLIMEAYHLYKSGFDWQLTKADIALLNNNTDQFEDYSMEYELIQKYLLLPSIYPDHIPLEMSSTEIKVFIETKSNQKISLKKLGQELKRIGFLCETKKANGKSKQIYYIITGHTNYEMDNISGFQKTENMPF